MSQKRVCSLIRMLMRELIPLSQEILIDTASCLQDLVVSAGSAVAILSMSSHSGADGGVPRLADDMVT